MNANTSRKLLAASAGLLAFLAAGGARVLAQSGGVQFDFNTGRGSMADDISPAHPASSVNDIDGTPNLGGQGLLPATATSWNSYGTAPTGDNVGLVWADGSSFTGGVLQFGTGYPGDNGWGGDGDPLTPGFGLINWLALWSYDGNSSGVQNTALIEDVIYRYPGDTIGVRVKGFAPGCYRVYAFAQSPDAPGRTQYCSIGIDLTAHGQGTVSTIGPGSANNAAWTAGNQFAQADVTVTSASDWVAVIMYNPSSSTVFNGMQIVKVPPAGGTTLAVR